MLVIVYISVYYECMNIDLHSLNTFYTVAVEKSFSKAAEKLFVSQPAVSQAVKLIENQIGFPLFIRQKKEIKLTAEAQEIFSYCKNIFNSVELLNQNLADIKNLESGILTIGASDTICKYYLIDKLKKFESLYPKIRYRVTNCTTRESLSLLKNGDVDLAFVHAPLTTTSEQVIDVMELHDYFVCSSEFDDSAIHHFADLQNYRTLLLENESHSRLVLNANLAKYGVFLKPKFELASLDLLIEFAKKNMGIICVAKEYIQSELKNGELKIINIEEKLDARHISLVISQKNYLSNAAKKFIEKLN